MPDLPDPAALAALPRITIEGRTFRYQARAGDDPPPGKPDGPSWWLYGARGAVYFTVRSVPHPDRMFVVNGKTMSQPFPRTWLTDSDGQLKVLS